MSYVINTCLDSAKYPRCQGCPHHRKNACWINEDLKGKERLEYLTRLLKAFESGDAVVPPTRG